MIIFLLLYIFLCLYGVRVRRNDEKSDYLSIENTQAIKGIFIILVFFSHFNSYVEFALYSDKIYASLIGMFGQTMVTLFMFYSGYGVMESIKKKGEVYVEHIPTNRVLVTLLKFDCAVFLFLIVGLIKNNTYSFKKIAFSFIGWDSVGNSNWYIFVILLLYLITYSVFKLLGCENKTKNSIIILFTVCFLICFTAYFNVKPSWWYDTALCYVLGLFYSLFRKYIDRILNSSFIAWFFTLFLSLILGCILYKFRGASLVNLIFNLTFCMTVIILTMRVKLNNKILVWCGKNLFELYILQRLPMIIFKELKVMNFNIYIYFILCVFGTVFLVVPFKKITNKIVKLIQELYKIRSFL